MALTAKVRGQWRVVSRAMARRFRARGVEVQEIRRVGDEERVVTSKAPTDLVVSRAVPGVTSKALADELAARELAWKSRPAIKRRVELDRSEIHADLTKDSPPPPIVMAPAAIADMEVLPEEPVDLTDEELERLTAPDAAGGEG